VRSGLTLPRADAAGRTWRSERFLGAALVGLGGLLLFGCVVLSLDAAETNALRLFKLKKS
jgi:hypothetical protein